MNTDVTLMSVLQRNDEQASIIRNLKRDLEDEKEERSREQAREARRAKEDADEIESMRRRIENMEQNRLNDIGEVRIFSISSSYILNLTSSSSLTERQWISYDLTSRA